jgi:hypothetical protein
MSNVVIHSSDLRFNGTELECDGNELRPDGTCAKCERVNRRIEAEFSSLPYEQANRDLHVATNADVIATAEAFEEAAQIAETWCDDGHSGLQRDTAAAIATAIRARKEKKFSPLLSL